MLGVNDRMGLKLFGRKIIFEEFQPKRHGQTDGQTDDMQSHITALCASVAR